MVMAASAISKTSELYLTNMVPPRLVSFVAAGRANKMGGPLPGRQFESGRIFGCPGHCQN